MNRNGIDLTALRERRARARVGGWQIDPRGATKPARDPEEAAFLRSIGRESAFTEVEMPGWKEWRRWRYTPREERDNSLSVLDFCPPENR